MREQRRIRLANRPLDLWQHNGTWTLRGTRLVNTPTLGSELLIDGALENWLIATNLTSWTETIAGTSTVNQETSVIHGGSNAARLDVDGSNSAATLSQAITATIGIWYQMSAWSRADSATPAMAMNGGPVDVIKTIDATYNQYFLTVRAVTITPTILVKRSSAASRSLYFDDVSMKPLTLNQLFAVRAGASLPASVVGNGTIGAGNWAGVVYGLDSISAPTNGIIAAHDGTTAIVLLKLVAGVWTAVLSTTATYVAGLLPQIKWVSANTFGLWYNGVQRGANQTISDAGTGLLHGAFSTSPLNMVTNVIVN